MIGVLHEDDKFVCIPFMDFLFALHMTLGWLSFALRDIVAIFKAQCDRFQNAKYCLQALFGPAVGSPIDLPTADRDHCCVHAVEFLEWAVYSFRTSWLIWTIMPKSAIHFAAV